MKTIRLGVIGTCCRGFIADYAQQPENGVEVVAGADCYELQRRDSLSATARNSITKFTFIVTIVK